ncbi:MAG: hypothetical protein ABL995_11345, partial [Bryobacteraceae bacterium]
PAPAPSRPTLDQQAREVLDEVLQGNLPSPTDADIRAEINRTNENVGEDALSCLEDKHGVNGSQDAILNTCSFRIAVAWCVEGVDCKPTFSNMNNMNAWIDKSKPAPYLLISGTEGKIARKVWKAACKGIDSIVIERGGEPYYFHCVPGRP